MDRRALLALIATLPAVVASAAEACIVFPFDAGYVDRQNARIRLLFEAWWARDLPRFESLFRNPIKHDGLPLEPGIVEAWRRDGVYLLPRPTRALFGRFFTNRRTSKWLGQLVNTQLGIVVACSESTGAESIVACSDGGQSHLFFVQMSGLNPISVTHLNSGSGGEEDRFVVSGNDAR